MVTKQQEDIIIYLYVTFSIISLIADLFIIIGYLRFRALQKLAFAFVFYIACADVCRSLAQTWGPVESPVVCKIQGWLQTFGAVAMGLFFLSIATICLSIKRISSWWKKQTPKNIKNFQIIIALIVTITAFLCASIPWNQYITLTGWCWISGDEIGHLFRYLFYYGWLMVCLFLTIIIYCELFRIIKKENKVIDNDNNDNTDDQSQRSVTNTNTDGPSAAPSKLNTKKKQKKMFDQMKLYPLALIIGQGPGALRRVIELITDEEAPFGFILIHAICSGLFGFITACIYGSKTWEIYRYKIRLMCNIQSNQDNNDDIKMDSTNDNGSVQNLNDQNDTV